MDRDRLKTIPLFSSLSEKALDTLSVFSSETSVSAGKRLVHEGDYSYDLIVIETGTADVIKGGEVIGSLGPKSSKSFALTFTSSRVRSI